MTDGALDLCARNGYDPVYGARPLKRYIQKTFETPIARAIIGGAVNDGGKIRIAEKSGTFDFQFENAEKE